MSISVADGITYIDGQVSASQIQGTVQVSQGGTGATTEAAARTSLFGLSATTNNAIPRFNGTTGALQNSVVTIDNTGNMTGMIGITASGTIQGTRILPSSNVVPTTGMYLPAPNTLGFAAGSVALVAISTAGINLALQPISVSANGVHVMASAGTAGGGLRFDTIASSQGAQSATMLNSPVAGNPSFYIAVFINGTLRYIPAW